MDQPDYLLSFENCSPREARSAGEDLEIALFQALPSITIDWEPSHTHAQDIGSILSILLPILGTPAIVVFANTLSDWLKRRKDIILTIHDDTREVIIKNITYKEAEQILPQLTNLTFSESPHNKEEEGKHVQSPQ